MSRPRMQFQVVPGDTPRERFENLARHLFTIPKTELERRQAEYLKERVRKKRQRKKGNKK